MEKINSCEQAFGVTTVTAADGLDSASQQVRFFFFLHKSGRGTCAKVGVTRNFVVSAGELHTPSVTQDRFYTV